MRKQILALALAMCLGLSVPALAANTASVTVAGISFDAVVADQYESYRDSLEESVAAGYSWAPALLEEKGEIAQFQYDIGLINYGPEDGVRDFWTYLVYDDVTLDFHVKKDEKITIEGYYLAMGEHKAVDEQVYIATFMGSWSFPALKDGALVDKEFFDQNYPGVNYLHCYRGDYNPDISYDETLDIVFVNEDGALRPASVPDAESTTPSASTQSATAVPTSAPVLVNGKNTAFDAYEINDNNYFKLRDLAYVLSGTDKQFEVTWDAAANAIGLTAGKAYTAVGGEMTSKGAGGQTAVPTTSKILLDGKEVALTAYEIGGNNYFKLRDIGAAFDFGVDWDAAAGTIRIDTSKGYTSN